MKKEDYTLRLDQKIIKLEQLIESLLAGITISELTPFERFRLATHLIALHQRGLVIGHTFELDNPENRDTTMEATFYRFVRGNPDLSSDPTATDVVDAELTAFQRFLRGEKGPFSNLEPKGVVDSKLEGTEITWLDSNVDVDDDTESD